MQSNAVRQRLESVEKLQRGQRVTVLDEVGNKAGEGVVDSYNLDNRRYRVWFEYKDGGKELIELPTMRLVREEGKPKIVLPNRLQ